MLKKKKRILKQFMAVFLSLAMVFTIMPSNYGGYMVVNAATDKVDGTTKTAPEEGVSYFFDFLNNTDLYNGVAGKYGLLTTTGATSSNSHGPQYGNGTSLQFQVAGSCSVNIGYCAYDTEGTGFTVESSVGSIGVLPVFPAKNTYTCFDSSLQTFAIDYTAPETTTETQTITIHFTSTYYIPYIEIVPVTDESSTWQARNFSLNINSTTVNVTGADSSTGTSMVELANSDSDAISEVYDKDTTSATIGIDLGGNELSDSMLSNLSLTSGEGSISASVVDGNVVVNFSDTTIEPLQYTIQVYDTGKTPIDNTTYTYDFSNSAADVIVPSTYVSSNPITTLWSPDGLLKINGGGTMYSHDSSHGLIVKNGNSFDVKVAGNAYIIFSLCSYSNGGTIQASGGAEGSVISKASAPLKGSTDGETTTFIYSGSATTLTFTLSDLSGTNYLHKIDVQNTTEAVDVVQWAQKNFSLSIGDTSLTVKGATAQDSNATATVSAGEVYYALSEEAYVSVDLNGQNLSTSMISNTSTDVIDTITVNEDGTINVKFVDQTTYPYNYTIKVQDSDSFVTPGVSDAYTFDFGDGAIPTSFTSKSPIINYFTTNNGILTLAKGSGTSSPYWHDATHGLALYNGNYFDVKVAGNAKITFTLCAYGNGGTLAASNLAAGGEGSFDSNVMKGSVCESAITYTYTGDATTLRFTLTATGESYLHAITVKNSGTQQASDVANEQISMPVIVDSNGTLTATPVGHRLYFSQVDTSSSISTLSKVGYYLFDARDDACTIEADIKISAIGSTSNNGIFMGMFENADTISKIATVGIRGGSSIRNIYNKIESPTTASAGSIDKKYTVGDIIHVKMYKVSTGWYSAVTVNSVDSTAIIKYSSTALLTDSTMKVRYGFALANVDAIVTNLKFTGEDGTVLYDQNDCYDAVGSAPNVTTVNTPVLSSDRTTISVDWSGDTAADDGAYKVELSSDAGANYTVLSNNVTNKNYTADVNGSGTYQFRISGVCGDLTSTSVVSPSLSVLAPLPETTITAESNDSKINLSWTAVDGATTYDLYRKSSEESDYTLITSVSELSYADTAVENETPYYYYIIAKSDINQSNGSNVVLCVPSAGHVGDYVYEEDATDITITKKSYDTVFTNKATLEGIVSEAGTMVLNVNGEEVTSTSLAAKGTFSYLPELNEGRNDVNLYFTDQAGNTTRKTFNFVYLTNYDIIVDASYTGEDGAQAEAVEGVKMYKTVQAAVNSVASDNAERVVILIKEGTYSEHLTITSPYITLIGEDREKVNLSYFDAVETPVGGDTSKRCSTYVKSTAKYFSAENLTFENPYEFLGDGSISNESADALRVDAEGSSFVNVKLLGYQDTLDASLNHQYYYKCYITGNIDFVYGSAQALFDDCDLVFRYNANKNSGYITAPKTAATANYGYIFNNCRILAESACSGSKYLLARPWGPDGAAAFIKCYMSNILYTTNPYSDMSGNLASKARFYEYYTYGGGFAINSNRPQLSKSQAEAMLTINSLGWDPYTTNNTNATSYVGTISTSADDKYIETNYQDEEADPNSTDDAGLGKYKQEGYATAEETSGGGLLLNTSKNYYQVATASEFLSALSQVKTNGKPSVIELTNDIALGSIEIGSDLITYSSIIKEASNQALLHPTLIASGVSSLKLERMSDLTIFSQNGSKITHTCINVSNSSNIIFRNIVFDELWEWDEGGSNSSGEYCDAGEYDRNDWDYVTVESGSTGIWIDHCTFYKSYDGIVDVKKAVSSHSTDVTISWCEFLPKSSGTFFDDMMNLLESNPASYPYYNKMLTELSMTGEQIRTYAAAQKKTHLIGASDTEANYKNLRLTLANNYYKNSMDRMPRLRGGYGHVYNCIMDATDLYVLKNSLTDPNAAAKIVSNGAISTCGASVLVENSNITNIMNAVLSGNASSPGGYINVRNSAYYMDGTKTDLAVTDYAKQGLLLDADAFVTALPYQDYTLYNAESLQTLVAPYVGAGKVNMSYIQWEKIAYNDDGSTTPTTTYSISFDSQGGSSVASQTVSEGSLLSAPANPTKTGFTFGGWYKESECINAWNFSTDTVSSNTTLYAKWTVINVSTLSLNNTKLSLAKGATSTLEVTVSPSDAYNKNVTWSSSNTKVATVNESGKVTAKKYGTATITVMAQDGSGVIATCKVTVGYKITYKLNHGTNHSSNPTSYYNAGVTLKNPNRAGYIFKGWYTDKKYENKISKIKKGTKKDYTLYAKWEKVSVSKVSISSITNSKKNCLKIVVDKISDAKGYEITYATNKKFTNKITVSTSSTNKTLRNLVKGKTYYVKIKAYKLDSAGNKVYGKYSSVKKIKISK